MTRQNIPTELLNKLKGKLIKVVIQEINTSQVLRGILVDVNETFIHVKGDYTEHILPIASIIKISSSVERK
ncbi:MAG: hypothetical protein AABW79_00695 [Nanoarchaeota archaeon]